MKVEQMVQSVEHPTFENIKNPERIHKNKKIGKDGGGGDGDGPVAFPVDAQPLSEHVLLST